LALGGIWFCLPGRAGRQKTGSRAARRAPDGQPVVLPLLGAPRTVRGVPTGRARPALCRWSSTPTKRPALPRHTLPASPTRLLTTRLLRFRVRQSSCHQVVQKPGSACTMESRPSRRWPLPRAPQHRRAADAAGASLTWARSFRQTAVASVVPLVLSTTPRRRRAVCSARLVPSLVSLSTPASAAPDA
jgi:hypothetical protein